MGHGGRGSRQTTEDRRQRTEDRGQKKVNGNTVEEKIRLPFTVHCSPDALRFDKYDIDRIGVIG
jgi:hypothetical protein